MLDFEGGIVDMLGTCAMHPYASIHQPSIMLVATLTAYDVDANGVVDANDLTCMRIGIAVPEDFGGREALSDYYERYRYVGVAPQRTAQEHGAGVARCAAALL